MRAVRITWAVVAVLGVAGAFFVPVVVLPFLLAGALIGRRASRTALIRSDGLPSAGALLPPLLVLVVVFALGPAWTLWRSRREANWNFFGPFEGPFEALGPNPSRSPALVEGLTLSPLDHLVYWDPWFAGVFLPALIVVLPVALVLAVWLTSRSRS